ncbi:MAG: hypothetical protein Q7R91_01465 [bacterium]|nr:hypothetical protein [bacterium]
MRTLGVVTQKTLLLLLGGVGLSLSGPPDRYRRVLKAVAREWREIDNRELHRAIRRLYESKLVSYKENKDGTVSVVLNREGQKTALRYKFDDMKIPKPSRWDQKWRVILFDIPETQKRLRDVLRIKLRQLGLQELQKSVFVHPYECKKEIDFVIELYDVRRYVRFIEAFHIDNELHLKKKFQLI